MDIYINILAQADAGAATTTTATQVPVGAPEGEQAPATGSNLMAYLPFVLVILAFYFLIIAPNKKRQREQQAMINSIETGDEVLTIGGIVGKVTNKDEKHYILKVDDGTKIKFLKSAIASKLSSENSTEVVEQK